MESKPKLLVVSHVLPFPRRNGQQQRVYYTLQAARERFHITFLSSVDPRVEAKVRKDLLTVCDDAILLPSKYFKNSLTRLWHRGRGFLYALATGLKLSNYLVGKLELSAERLEEAVAGKEFDAVLYEYWHAFESIPVFRKRNIPTVLDMHNVLWQSHIEKLKANKSAFEWWERKSIGNYQVAEEASWKEFDGVIAITREEHDYVKPRVKDESKVFYAPMGVDLTEWEYSWNPTKPKRVAFYGGMSSLHNQKSALRCYHKIMPIVWERFPETELWIVGSNPPDEVQALESDSRVKVTGFVEKVQHVLCTTTAVLCPWVGTYGFRSRLIEAMGLGVPVVASPDAVAGMELDNGKGLLLGEEDQAMADHVMKLLGDIGYARDQSRSAREEVERLYGMSNTYGRLIEEVNQWIESRKGKSMPACQDSP